VSTPRLGLFDASTAERWIRRFAPMATRGFRVALPAYGSRVRFDEIGRPIAVESEMLVDAAEDADASELRAEPADVAALLRALTADPPPHWNGIAWFRLPVAGDQRAWTLAAIREVEAGHVPAAQIATRAITRSNGASDIVVLNEGVADARAPVVRVFAQACSAADATSGWRVERMQDGWRFVADASSRLRAKTRTAIGWVRCANADSIRVESG
jgi:hypothetical protein